MASFKVDINLKEGGLPSAKPSTTSNKGGSSIFDVISSVFKSLKIASILAIIVSIVTSFKPLMKIISGIGKMISYLLQPIAMVIMTLLYPILIILKPIMIAINQLMAPFTKAAMQLFGEGETTKGVGVLMGGISIVLIKIFAESIKFAGGLVLTAVASLFGLVSSEMQETLMNEILPAFYQAVDDTAAFLSGSIIAETSKLLEGTSVDFDEFVNNAFGAVESAYAGMSEEALKGLKNMQENVLDKDYTAALVSMTTGITSSWISFGTSVSNALRLMITDWLGILGIDEADEEMLENTPWYTKLVYCIPLARALINVAGTLAVMYDNKHPSNTYMEIG